MNVSLYVVVCIFKKLVKLFARIKQKVQREEWRSVGKSSEGETAAVNCKQRVGRANKEKEEKAWQAPIPSILTCVCYSRVTQLNRSIKTLFAVRIKILSSSKIFLLGSVIYFLLKKMFTCVFIYLYTWFYIHSRSFFKMFVYPAFFTCLLNLIEITSWHPCR